MAHNARIRTPGGWTLASVIAQAELEAFDTAQFLSIHEEGGVWAMTDVAEIGGAGFRFTSQLEIGASYGTFLCNGTATFNDDFKCYGPADFYGTTIVNTGDFACAAGVTATFNDDVTLTGAADFDMGSGTLTLATGNLAVAAGNCYVGGTMQIIGAASINGTLTLNAALTAAGATFTTITASGTCTFNGNIAANNPIVLGGDGRIRYRTAAIGGDVNATYDVAVYDTIYIPAGVITGTRTYTIANATNGDRIHIFRADTTNNDVVIKRADTSTIATLNLTGSSKQRWVTLQHIAGQWEMIAKEQGA